MKTNNHENPLHKKSWKEFLGESLMIVFSVLLALFLSEYVNNLHEKQQTKVQIKNIVNELDHNKKALQEMYVYNLQVLKKIDSALVNTKFQNKIINNDEFHLNLIAPEGVLYRYFDNKAWSVAKNNNIISKIDIQSVIMLTGVYEDLEKTIKIENDVAKVFLDRASRDPKQIHATLVIIRDIYHGWAVDREPGLISQIDAVIKKMESRNE